MYNTHVLPSRCGWGSSLCGRVVEVVELDKAGDSCGKCREEEGWKIRCSGNIFVYIRVTRGSEITTEDHVHWVSPAITLIKDFSFYIHIYIYCVLLKLTALRVKPHEIVGWKENNHLQVSNI